MKWIYIKERFIDGRKTKLFYINSIDDNVCLGLVKWHSRWRKYCFFPMSDTVFEQVCLRDIADFIEQETKDHRRKLNETKTKL